MSAIEVESPLGMVVLDVPPASVVHALLFFDSTDTKLKIGTTGTLGPISGLVGTIAAQTGPISALGASTAWDWVVTR